MSIFIASSATLVLYTLLNVYIPSAPRLMKLLQADLAENEAIFICTYMCFIYIYALIFFRWSSWLTCHICVASGIADSHHGRPLSTSECNLRWQQLPDKFGWVRKLYPWLQLQRRAGLAAPRWGLPPHPLLQPRPPLPPRGAGPGDWTSRKPFTTVVGLVYTT